MNSSCLSTFLRRPIKAVNSALQLLAALNDCTCSLSVFTMICVTSRLLYIKRTNMGHFAAPDWSEIFTAECYQHVWIFLCISCFKILLQMLNPGGPNGLIVKSCSGLWIVLQDQGHALAHPGLLMASCLFWCFCGFCLVCCTNSFKTVWKQQPSSLFLLLFSLVIIEMTCVCLQEITCCCECYHQSIPDSQSPSTATSTVSLPWCCNWRAQSSST